MAQVARLEREWCFRCRTCLKVFTSSQGLAGHQGKHKSEGTWRKGVTHYKFFVPSVDLPTVYHQLGNRKTTPTVLPGQRRFYRPRPRNPAIQGPRRRPGRPRSIFDPSQLVMVPQVPPQAQQQGEMVHVPHVDAHASVSPLCANDKVVKKEVEQLDLELRL